MPINKRLFKWVRDYILEEPRRYEQGTFGENVPRSESPCGTQACILGWAAILSGRIPVDAVFTGGTYGALEVEGREALGLSEEEGNVVAYDWPVGFQEALEEAETKEEEAKVAADYIDHILSTGSVR